MNTANNPDPADYEQLSEPERFALELRWYNGEMLPYVEWLLAFAARHRAEILEAASGQRDPALLVVAMKRLITERGSVHLRAELSDQRRELANELWYRGERGEHDRARIEVEWTVAHAAAWRRWRICEYLFVADRLAVRIVAVLLASGGNSAASAAM